MSARLFKRPGQRYRQVMRWVTRSLALLLAACGGAPHRADSLSESKPQSFFAIAGLTQTTETRRFDNGWGITNSWRLLVHRNGRVVCSVPEGVSAYGEYGASTDDAQLTLASQQPVRFVVHHRYQNHRTNDGNLCVGYELPSDGDCREIFDRNCTHEVCKSKIAISPMSGSGALRGRVKRKHDPVAGASVIAGAHSDFTGKDGAFAILMGPGTYDVEIDGAGIDAQRATVTIGPREDVEVAVDIACSNVYDTSCCNF